MNNSTLEQSLNCAIVNDKYLTLANLPRIYFNHLPNPKEFMNNAAWRLIIDALVEHYIPGLGTQPFYKEVVYNVAGVPSAVSSSLMGFNIGQTNNTYGPWHAVYSVARAAGKIAFVGTAAYQDPSKISTPGALEEDSKTANYVVDTIIRWMPFHAEKLQMNNKTEVYTPTFYSISMVSGLARTYGSQTGGKIVKWIEKFTLSDVIDSSSYIINPIKNYLPAAASYLSPVETCLSGLSSFAKQLTFENIANNLNKFPVLDIAGGYLANSLATTKSGQSTINQLKGSYTQGVINLFSTTALIVTTKLAWNFFSSLILIPSSRIVGVFFEDVLTCADDMNKGKTFFPPDDSIKNSNLDEVKLIEDIQQKFDEF